MCDDIERIQDWWEKYPDIFDFIDVCINFLFEYIILFNRYIYV